MKTFTNEAATAAYNKVYELTKTLSAEDEGKLIAKLMSDMLNHSQNTDVEAFIEYWNLEHRTLQQKFTELVGKWLYHVSKTETGMYDARNAYSVGFAKGAIEGLKEFKFTPDCMELGLPRNAYEYDFDSYGEDPVKFPYI